MEKQKLLDLIMASITTLFMVIIIATIGSLWVAYEVYNMDVGGVVNNLPWIGLTFSSLEIVNLATWIALKIKFNER